MKRDADAWVGEKKRKASDMTNAPSLWRVDKDREGPKVWRIGLEDSAEECGAPLQAKLCEDMLLGAPLVAALMQFAYHQMWLWDELLGGNQEGR